MSFTDSLFGRPMATSEERAEHIGVSAGIPIFGLDALTSAAYGPETALSLLIPLGLMGIQYIVPIISAILILLVIVYFSYRQTIAAYPGGGGSYTVATENLGVGPGLLAAAAQRGRPSRPQREIESSARDPIERGDGISVRSGRKLP